MVYQVGSPAMFEGNRFLPETGTPIWKMLRSKTVLRTLRAGAVDRRDLNAHVVDDVLLPQAPGGFLRRYIRGGHPFPSL